MLISDIETNGLLDNVTKFHCACIYDCSTQEYKEYRPNQFLEYIRDLEAEIAKDGLLVFHNGINYDIPVIQKLAKSNLGVDFVVPEDNVLDTLVLSRLLYPNLTDIDYAMIRAKKYPADITSGFHGSHSLKSWGIRVNEHKGEYVDDYKATLRALDIPYTEGMEWAKFSEDMMRYNVQDVVVTLTVISKFLKNSYYFPQEGIGGTEGTEAQRFWTHSKYAVRLEHDIAWLMAKQERNGFPVNRKGLEELYATSAARRSELLLELINNFGSWYEPNKTSNSTPFTHPKTGKILTKYAPVVNPKSNRNGYTKGCIYTPIKHITFNPASRQHILKQLLKVGWQPDEFTDKGQPKVDEEALQHIKVDDEKAQKSLDLIREYLALNKLLGQLAEGKNAWLGLIKDDGCIHGNVNTNGAVTGRATHSNPNMAQVPSGKHIFGHACRSCFGASFYKYGDWVQVGIDAKGLELRCLGHYLAPFDGGDYADTVVNGDPHAKNQEAAGLPTRNDAKTFIYGFLYGAGAARIGRIVGGDAKRGTQLKTTFLSKMPAIKMLIDALEKTLVKSSRWEGKRQLVEWKRRFLIGLDGRQIHIRSIHAALNFLLQSAGAVVCKYWVVRTIKLLEAQGYIHGWHGDFVLMAWVHDEIQVAARNHEIAEKIAEVAQQAMEDTAKFFNFKCPLDVDAKIGVNWAECH